MISNIKYQFTYRTLGSSENQSIRKTLRTTSESESDAESGFGPGLATGSGSGSGSGHGNASQPYTICHRERRAFGSAIRMR